MSPVLDLGAKPITTHVDGAPFQPGWIVRVVAAVDAGIHDVSAHIGEVGRVAYLEYSCGCGQVFPTVPMVGVELSGGVEEFWPEEIQREAT